MMSEVRYDDKELVWCCLEWGLPMVRALKCFVNIYRYWVYKDLSSAGL